MPKKKSHVPAYCLHKPSGRAYVRIHGKVVYVGEYGTDESKQEYGRRIAELAASPAPATTTPSSSITVVELIDAYWVFAQGYYQKDGTPSRHLDSIRLALRPLKEMYGDTAVNDFGPKSLKAIRQRMVDSGRLNRTTINKRIDNIRRVFRWGVADELVDPLVLQGLQAVAVLKMGRSEARESKPIQPVDDELVNATLPYLTPIVADMVRFQRLTGCRPGEVCQIRPCDVDQTNEVWEYRPPTHKTQYRGRDRVVYVGPKAQIVLLPYLERDPEATCFSPAESEDKRHKAMRARRKTRVQPSQRNRRKKRRQTPPRTAYDKNTYNRAIGRAIKLANKARTEEAADMGIEPILLPHWHANQLRHSAATSIRRQYGLEAAQVLLGHAKADVTQVYAERDTKLAVEVSKKIG